MACMKASCLSLSPKQATSPVEAISTPRVRISATKTSKGEHGSLDADVVDVRREIR